MKNSHLLVVNAGILPDLDVAMQHAEKVKGFLPLNWEVLLWPLPDGRCGWTIRQATVGV